MTKPKQKVPAKTDTKNIPAPENKKKVAPGKSYYAKVKGDDLYLVVTGGGSYFGDKASASHFDADYIEKVLKECNHDGAPLEKIEI